MSVWGIDTIMSGGHQFSGRDMDLQYMFPDCDDWDTKKEDPLRDFIPIDEIGLHPDHYDDQEGCDMTWEEVFQVIRGTYDDLSQEMFGSSVQEGHCGENEIDSEPLGAFNIFDIEYFNDTSAVVAQGSCLHGGMRKSALLKSGQWSRLEERRRGGSHGRHGRKPHQKYRSYLMSSFL